MQRLPFGTAWGSQGKRRYAGHLAAAMLGASRAPATLWSDWFFGEQGPSHGLSQATLGLALVASGGSPRSGSASLDAGLALVASGGAPRSGSASLRWTTASAAVGLAPMAGIGLVLDGDPPLRIPGVALQGYHRPLNGEVASLTATVDRAALFPDWLQAPLLGCACRVEYDGQLLIAGALYAVRASATALELRVEG